MTTGLLRLAKTVVNKLTRPLFARTPHAVDDCPLTHGTTQQLWQDLIARGESPATITPHLLQLERESPDFGRYQALRTLHARVAQPHQVNYLLAQEEFQRGAAEMTAYPTYVLMDISNICTVECKFCKYTHDFQDKRWLSLEEMQRFEWLQYALYLNFTAGTAEALSNPQFIPIFDYIYKKYPHLIFGLLTNGRTLSEKILNALEGRLHELHVSMNASNEQDYNEIIANGSWSLFARNMKHVQALARRTKKPWVQASFVKMRWNLDRAVADLEFAFEHGATKVLFHHFYPHYIQDLHSGDSRVLAEKFGPQQSLYFDKEKADDVFARVRERGKELGVDVETPPPFAGADTHITWGARTSTPPPSACAYPWTHMFMLWGWKSRREEITMCCGLASDTGIYFDWHEIMTKDGLFKTWNSPTMQAYRRTANGRRVNPVCALCRTIDRFDPHSIYPDQRKFFEFNDLPVPPHFKEGKWPSLTVIAVDGKEAA
ncbi:MAG: radical SAM protein [Gemmataceae bacterium]|nr:radical SAM protein [Gemmataceae bacterium]